MDYDVDAVIKRTGRLLDAGDPQSLDQALMLLGTSIGKCTVALEKGKRRKKVKADGTATDTWSRAADDEDEDGVGKRLDNIEEALDDVIEKLGGGATPRYPHGNESDLLAHENMHAGDVTVYPNRAHVDFGPLVQAPSRHRFDDLVDQVHARDGGSRAAAMVTARSENPVEFSSYQHWHATGTTQSQSTARGDTSGQLRKLGSKPAPAIYPDSEDKAPLASPGRVKGHLRGVRRHTQQVAKTWEEAVSDEIRKFGVTPEIAAVRVINAYGNNLPHEDFAKSADTINARWGDAVTEIAKRDGVDRCEALRRLRHEQPKLYRALQADVLTARDGLGR